MKQIQKLLMIVLLGVTLGFSQEINRYGTTTASFLEIGIGSAASAMGEAYVGVANDLSSIYWNPAGLASIKQSEALFVIQPWVIDINTFFAGAAVHFSSIGTLALGLTQVDYGEMEVTTLEHQDGTGEKFTANDLAASLSFARELVPWFSFGISAKLIHSNIWRSNANAFALDLGVIVNTHFFSVTDEKKDGMTIGMSISNYGTRMRYDGIDLLNPIDISLYESGNYGDVPGQFRTQAWELPLLFRIGVAVKPIVSTNHKLIIAADALHPNNNTESVNVGAQYEMHIPGAGKFFLRGGYKALFMKQTEYGVTFGGGIKLFFMSNHSITVDYAYKSMGILGNIHAYTVGMTF